MDTADIQIASRTQDPETIQRILEEGGYGEVTTSRLTDRPEEKQPETSTQPPAAGESAGAPGEGGNPPPGAAPEPAQDRKTSGSARLRARLAERDAQLTATRAELDALKAKLAAPAGEPAAEPATPATDDPEPQLEDYADYSEWLKAFSRWDRKREEHAAASAGPAEPAQPEPAGATAPEVDSEWQDRIEQARDEFEDYDQVALNPNVVVSPAMVNVIRDIEEGARLAYLLGRHPELSQEIAQATALAEGFTQRDARRVLYLAHQKLEALLPRLSELSASPPAAPPAPPVVTPLKEPAPVKHTPPVPIGSRGTPTQRAVTEMTADELRHVDPSIWRKAREQ